MFTIAAFLIIAACAAYAIYAWLIGRLEARECGRNMSVRYDGHIALNRRRILSAGSGVTPEPHVARSYEVASPSALDLLYEQMTEQDEGFRRRERERERECDY